MTYTASIYFLGQYRPAYFEADTARAATKVLLASIRECDDYTKLCEWIKQSYSEIKKPNCAAFSVEHGARGISIAKRPHDPFLDTVTRSMPAYPGLDYSNAVNQ